MKKIKPYLKKMERLLLFFMLLVAINGCKKENAQDDLNNQQRIRSAKAWYNKQIKSQAMSFQSSKKETAVFQYNPDWDNALIEIIDNAPVISIPVITNVKSLFNDDAKSWILITYHNKLYDLKNIFS